MKYCKRCLQINTRPRIRFDDEGVCFACRCQEKIDHEIDWEKRKKELRKIVDWAKKNSNGKHDCVIGVSGGKDSIFQALYAKEELGLNCLLVNLAPDKITKWGAHNIENLIQHGFDTMMYRPNPYIWKRVIKYSLYKYGNPIKPTEYPLYAVANITALKFGIPLIIQGENPGITLGEVEGGIGDDGNALNAALSNTLNGGNASDWTVDGIKLNELIWYQIPDKNKLMEAGIRAIYLNYYVKEYCFGRNIEFAIKHGLHGRENHDPMLTGRLSPYSALDAESHQIVNQMIKYYKFGLGFVTDETSYRIREGKMTRDEAIELVKKYDGKCGDVYLKDFCDYIDITVEEFWRAIEPFVNKNLFRKNSETGKWIPKFEVGVDFNDEDL
ncbi:MAG: N-acetyl sugar amidotransferase [Deltaproteobacteria bacterium]|nr:N-acetyl sugar amidotransferase [Deltaproteobacteria bacterium]